jgi:outer membrane protein
MKIKMFVLVLLTFALIMTANSALYAASSPRIGYFDLSAVLDKSTPGMQAKDNFNREKDQMKVLIDEKAKTFKTARDEFEKKKAVMDESTKKRKTQEIMQMQQEGEKFLMESNAKLSKLSNDLMSPIVDKILEIARKIGREDKYDLILEAGKAGVVYGNDKEDLTSKITSELNRNPPSPKK